MGDLRVSEAVNGVLIALIGTGLPQASETGARVSSQKLAEFGRRMRELEQDIDYSVAHIGDSLPGDAGREYVRAMSVLTGADGGTNYLREYERSLRSVAAGHRDQSMNIQESKWQIIAELIRLVIELTILAATAWINPAAAGQAAVAKARSTTVFLTVLDLFLRRTHLMPSLSEALEEAFQTLVVRLGLMAFNDPDMRPSGVDWRAVWQSAAFGGAAGWLSGPLRNFADRFNGLFAKSGSRGLFKDLSGDVTSKSGRDLPGGGGTSGNSPQSFGARLASSPRRVSEFVADGLTEALPETLLAMAFFGTPFSWSAFATTFWTSAVSEQTSDLLGEGVTHGVGNVREAYDDSAFQAKNTAGVTGAAVPTSSRGTSSTTGGTTTAPTGSGRTRPALGTDVNALDVLDRIGAPGVTAPTTETGTGRTGATDTESVQAPRTTGGSGTRPVTERAVPDEVLGTDRPGLAAEPQAEDVTAPGTTASPTTTASAGVSTGSNTPSTNGTSATADTNRAINAPASEANRANAASPDGRTAAAPEAARTTGAPPAQANRPSTTSSPGADPRTPAAGSARTAETSAPSVPSAISEKSRAEDRSVPPVAETARPTTTTGSSPSSRSTTTGSPAADTFAQPERDTLREELPAAWAASAPTPDDITTAHNIVRTHQRLTEFEPAERPSFADLDPGHLAVYAVALDLSAHDDIDRSEALSRRLAQGRPRAERGYLPGGSGRGGSGRPGEGTSGGSNRSERVFGPRSPRSASGSSGTGSVEPARRTATSTTTATNTAPAAVPTVPTATSSTSSTVTTPASTDAAQQRFRRLPVPPGSTTNQPGARATDSAQPDRSAESSRTSAGRRPAVSTASSTPADGTGTSTDAASGGRTRPRRQPMGSRGPDVARRDLSAPTRATGRGPDTSTPGHAPREVFRTVDVDDRPFEVLRVEPDGECFMTSTLAGLSRQLPGSPTAGLTVRQLRDHVGDWLAGNSAVAVARRAELDSGPSPVRVVVNDLGLPQLEDLLERKAPRPTPGQLAAIDRDLSRPQYVRELLRRFPDPADRSVIGDFTAGMAAALLPDFTPDPTQIRPADRHRLVADLRLTALREQAARELATVTPRSQALYTSLISSYPGLQRMFPRLRDLQALTPSAVAESAVRNVDMWTTPFYDQVPQLTALALDLNITPVQPVEGMGDLAFANPLNPSAARSLHVFYEGGDHYSAMNPVGGAVPVPSPVMITDSLLTGDSPVNGLPPAAPWAPPARPEPAALVAMLRDKGASDNLLARLNDLSPQAVDRLGGMVTRTRATADPAAAADQGTPPTPGSVLAAGATARRRRDAARTRETSSRPEPVVLTFPERVTDIGAVQARELDTVVELVAEQALINVMRGKPLPVLGIETEPARRARFMLPGTGTRDAGAVREESAERYVRDRLAEVLRDKQPAYRRHPVTADDFRIETGARARSRSQETAPSRTAQPANTVRITVDHSPPLNPAQEELAPEVLHDEWAYLARSVNPRREAALQIALIIVRTHQRVAGFQVEADPEFGDLPLSHRAVYAVAAALVRDPHDVPALEELSRTLAADQPPPENTPRPGPPAQGRSRFGRPSGDRALPAPPPVSGGTAFATTGRQHAESPVGVPTPVRPLGRPRVLALPLAVMLPAERRAALLGMTDDERSWIATDHGLVHDLRNSLSRKEFARTAAVLMVDVAPGVDQPVSARREAHRLFAALLRDPETTERILTSGARVTVIPKDVPLTDVAPFTALSGRALSGGRVWDDVRGTSGRITAISEENLLGENSALPDSEYADGYSTAAHELAHVVHRYGLSDADREAIDRSFRDRTAQGPDAQWPDGIRRDLHGRVTDNYSATDPYEYFAQLSNAYLGVNTGTDAATGRARNNGVGYVRAHEGPLRDLLERLYGTDPTLVRTGPANPVDATREENETYAAVRHLYPDLPPLRDEPPSADTPVGDLVRWNGPLTEAQTESVKKRVTELGRTSRLSAVRIVRDRLKKRAARLEGTRFQDEARELKEWVTRELGYASDGAGMKSPPKTVNFCWVGRPLSPAAVANVLAWAETARTHGWTVQMWTDTTPVTMEGDRAQKPSLSTWRTGTGQAFAEAGIRFRSVRDLFPPDRPPTEGDDGFTLVNKRLKKLRTIYDRARTTPTAFPVASDATRLGIMLYEGGTYADVDLEPGTVDLFSQPRKMGRSDIPLIGPMFRDQRNFQEQRAEFAEELRLRPDEMGMVDVASYAMTHGRFGNALMSTVPESSFFRRVIDAVDEDIVTWNAEELAAGGAFLTGPLTFTRAAFAQSATYGLGEVDGSEHGVAMDPFEVGRWAHIGWLTDESENQVDRAPTGAPVPGQLPPPLPKGTVSTVSGGQVHTGLPVPTGPGSSVPAGTVSEQAASTDGSDDSSDSYDSDDSDDEVTITLGARGSSTAPPAALTPQAVARDHRRMLADGTIAALSAQGRADLKADAMVMDVLAAELSPAEFGRLAAELMVEVPQGTDRPVSARAVAHDLISRMLPNPRIARTLLGRGARVVVLPRDTPLTDLPFAHHLRGAATRDGRPWDTVRGARIGAHAVIPEENLLGEYQRTAPYPDGFSSAVHEMAHLIHVIAMDDASKQLIEDAYVARRAEGPDESWPDGIRRDVLGNPVDNYSSTDVYEYFAQLSNVYFGVNAGLDKATRRKKPNGAEWVVDHEDGLRPLLEDLYGPVDRARITVPVNPVDRTVLEEEGYQGVRALFGGEPDRFDERSGPAAVNDVLRQDAVAPPDAGRLVRELPRVTQGERADLLLGMAPEHRRWLSLHHGLVDDLARSLSARDFAATAALLAVDVPENSWNAQETGVRVGAVLSRLLADPRVTARLLKSGAHVTVLPDGVSLTDLPQFRHLQGRSPVEGRSYESVTTLQGVLGTVVPQALLFGSGTPGSPAELARGLGEMTGSLARAVHLYGLTPEDRLLVDAAFDARRALGQDAPWPDGIRRDPGGLPRENTSSQNTNGYFAQLTRTYLRMNQGTDPQTLRQRENGGAWVAANEPGLMPLLERLYGPQPDFSAGGTVPTALAPQPRTSAIAGQDPEGPNPPPAADRTGTGNGLTAPGSTAPRTVVAVTRAPVSGGTEAVAFAASVASTTEQPPEQPSQGVDGPDDGETDPELKSEQRELASEQRELSAAEEESVAGSTSPEEKPLTVRFPKGSRTMADGEHEPLRELARRVAREALREHAAGRTPRVIRVRGRGNGSDHAGHTGNERAKNTARVLEAYLAAELRTLQTDVRFPLTTGDITILHGYEDTADQRRTDPYERRTAIVTLGDEGPDGVEWTSLRESGRRDRHELAETPTRILFGRGDKTVSGQGRQTIEDLADRIAVRALRERTPGSGPTVIRVAGRGNGRNTAAATGQLRAVNTEAALEQALARRLAELQSRTADPLTIDDFTIENVYDDTPRELYEDPLTHRQAIITVDWPAREDDEDRPEETALADKDGSGPTVEVVPLEGSLLALRSPSVPGNGFVEAVLTAHRDSIRGTADWYLDDGTPDPEAVLWLRKEMAADLIGSDVRDPLAPFPAEGLTVSAEELDLIGALETAGRETDDGTRALGLDDLTPLQYTRLLLLRSDGWTPQIAVLALERIGSLLTHDLTLFDLDNGTTHRAGPGVGSGRLVLSGGRFHWTEPHDPTGQDSTVGFAAMRKHLAAQWSQPDADDLTLAHNIVLTHQRLTSFAPETEPDFATLDPAHLAVYAVALDLQAYDKDHAEELSRQLAQGRSRAVRGYMPGGSGRGKGGSGGRKPKVVNIHAGPNTGAGSTAGAYGGGATGSSTTSGSGGYSTTWGQTPAYSQYGTMAAGSSGANPAPADWHGLSADAALKVLRDSPKRFLDNNVLIVRLDEGLRARSSISLSDAATFIQWMNEQDQHWFVLTKDPGRLATGGQPVYLLTPAVEKYWETFGGRSARLPEIVARIGVPRLDHSKTYLNAHFIPYLTGSTVDPDRNVGHTEIPVNGSGGSFGSSDFVFTPGMNGCALAVTASRVPGNFTAWHYQSPSSLSNVVAAEQFRTGRDPFEWFGHEQYMTSVQGLMPEATNFMWHHPNGWRILSQDNQLPFTTSNSVTSVRVQEKPLATGRGWIDMATIYQAMASERLDKVGQGHGEYIQHLKNGKRNQNLITAYGAVMAQAQFDVRTLQDANGPQGLVTAAQAIRDGHAATDPRVATLLAQQDSAERQPKTGVFGRPKADGEQTRRDQARKIIGEVSDHEWFGSLGREAVALAGRSLPLPSPGTDPYGSYAPSPGMSGRFAFSPPSVPSHGYASAGATSQGWPSSPGTHHQAGWGTAGGSSSGFGQAPRTPASSGVPVSAGTAYATYPTYPTYPTYSAPPATDFVLAPVPGGPVGRGSGAPVYPAYTTGAPSGSGTSSAYGYGYGDGYTHGPGPVPGGPGVPGAPVSGGTAFTGYYGAMPPSGFPMAPPPEEEDYDEPVIPSRGRPW